MDLRRMLGVFHAMEGGAAESSGDEWEDDVEERLYFALISDNAACVKELLDQGLSVNYKFRGMNQLNKTALHLACENGHYDCVKMLLERGAKCMKQDAWLQTPLMYCVCTGRDNLVKLLMSWPGCNPNVRCRHGKTALHFAVTNCFATCVRELLAGGACPDMRDEIGRTPLWHAMEQKDCLEIIQLLVEAGCDVDLRDIREKRTPLQVAILRGKEDTESYVQYLIDSNADVNCLDEFCHTPLMLVIRRHYKEGKDISEADLRLAQRLLDAGSDVDVLSRGECWYQFSGSALRMATERGAPAFVELLLKAGADPDVSDEMIPAALHAAAVKNRLLIGKMLIAAQCDVALPGIVKYNNMAQTMSAFNCCVLYEHWEFAEVLITHGYDLRHEEYFWTNEDVPEQLVLNFEFWGWIHQFRRNPLRLSLQCAKRIRNCLRKPIFASISELSVPPGIKNYLMMKEMT